MTHRVKDGPADTPAVPVSETISGNGRRIATVTAATVLAIGGSVLVVFLSVGLWLSNMGFATPGTTNGRGLTAWFVMAGIITVLAPPFLGGAAWGAGVAHSLGAPLRPAATTGALAFGGMIVATAAPTDITQLWLDDLPEWMPYGVHGYFTIVFMTEVGVVASVATWRLTRRLGLGSFSARIGLRTGVAAAVGFLAGSTIAFHVGYEVIPWRRLSMVWATVIAVPVSTLASGVVLGWHLRPRHSAGPTTTAPTRSSRWP